MNRNLLLLSVGACTSITASWLYLIIKRKLLAVRKRRNVFTVVLTGGPCGGKSSALKYLTSAIKELEINVFTVPESATILLSNGGVFPGINSAKSVLLSFEAILLNLQIVLENSFIDLAYDSGYRSVLLLDRGAIDISAYMPASSWNDLLRYMNWSEKSLTERYDLVCHLVTAADGAIEFYTLTNNTARSETSQDAIIMDKRCADTWKNVHTKVITIDNRTKFKEKMSRVTNIVVTEVKKHFNIE